MLLREIVLPQLVWLNGVGDFAGKYQDTITIRVPAKSVAHRRDLRGTGAARNLVTEDLTENAIPVTLDHDTYHAVSLTDEELTLDIHDFAAQVLNRQIRAVAEDLENGLVDTIAGADYASNNMIVPATQAAMFDAVVDARRKLNDFYVPRPGRVLVVGSAVEAAFLKDEQFARFDSTGDQPNTALRDATIGRVAGLNVVVSDALMHGDAYLFHPTAFIMATRPPAAPRGATFTAAASAAGLACRWLMDYDYSSTTDRSLVDTFVGYKAVEDPVEGFCRAVKIRLTATSVTVDGDDTVTAATGANHTSQLVAKTNWGEDVTSNSGVTWVSSAPSKATVSSTGLVTGVSAGTTDITAKFDGVTSATFTVTVS
ncbi:P22 phage major capsid protein family protein [Mycobacterium intracellulare]|uniref:P22 phage major capsid protein family protein n=1 Tax=Mycobacterium intracellulare TaxID=1767 RepID=UPI001F34C5AC|nr:P22 phage major capsid protein family protein [Mycobacterium intracellulare]